ncbi:MAG: DUF2442 domain-containing protein [Roseiarcus sp.]
MCAQSDAVEDCAAAVSPWPTPRSPWRVVDVVALPDYRLDVTFRDGLRGVVDMSHLIHSPNAGVFAALADPTLFAAVRIELGAPTWPGELDIAPDALHDAIQRREDRLYSLDAERSAP